jgi:hypothetical protein
MVPEAFDNFFIATAGAAAALTGLLFIAVSLAPERTAGPRAPVERRLVASGVLGSLSDAFFVSLLMLLPSNNVGVGVLVFAILYFAGFVPYALIATARVNGLGRRLRRATLLVTALVTYGWQVLIALDILRDPRALGPFEAIGALVLVLFGISLVRAWELLGASRFGLFARLSPLRDIDEAP